MNDYPSRAVDRRGVNWLAMAIPNPVEWLFTTEEIKAFASMVGLLAMIIAHGVLRAKSRQSNGESAVFMTKQKFQTLFHGERTLDE